MDERLLTDETAASPDTAPEVIPLGEVPMVREESWREVHRRFYIERQSKSEIARQLALDRKTVRTILRETAWQPYRREERTDTLLIEHRAFLEQRAPVVQYSARILFQELRRERGYRGSYETVRRFVRPLRTAEQAAERATVRFETPPGQQSQIDWGQARIYFRSRPITLHVFILTLGYSRRSFHEPCVGETLSQFLDAHERAFEHFGGHTREHLYDRPRTVCQPSREGRVVWNATFKQFADYWGFEPHLCRPYRAQTKGKVESGVKYFKRNFLPGRTFVDDQDLLEQLRQWERDVADVRLHGTTHERPVDRFAHERPALIGQTVEVARRAHRLVISHRGAVVAEHELLPGKYQMRILPEHGPGAVARTARRRQSSRYPTVAPDAGPEVEIRDLGIYEALGLAPVSA